MKKQLTKGIAISLLALSVWNCKTSDPEPTPYGDGVYIINQGAFGKNNGSLSYLSRTGNSVATNIFVQANPNLSAGGGTGQGGNVQDYIEINGKGLILVDNLTAGQDKVEIVEAGTFVSRATLKAPDIENPRLVIQAGLNKAYISCWDVSGDYSAGTFYKDPGYIAVVDLNSGTVVKKIAAVKGVEAMVLVGNEVFAGSTGYSGNELAIINTETNEVKQKITFSSSPRPVAVDADGKLWVLAGSEMIRMDVITRSIEKRLTLPASPSTITISQDKRTFFYSANKRTYKFGINDTSASTTNPVFNRAFSALGVDPQTKRIYASVIPSYEQAGYVLRYEETGVLVDSVKAEIAPSGFYFR